SSCGVITAEKDTLCPTATGFGVTIKPDTAGHAIISAYKIAVRITANTMLLRTLNITPPLYIT
ncbi:MAG: hypothetical protein V1752_02360, partial [Candidatus Firestonebacteria bacterium]